jgi:hypothetical protein
VQTAVILSIEAAQPEEEPAARFFLWVTPSVPLLAFLLWPEPAELEEELILGQRPAAEVLAELPWEQLLVP